MPQRASLPNYYYCIALLLYSSLLFYISSVGEIQSISHLRSTKASLFKVHRHPAHASPHRIIQIPNQRTHATDQQHGSGPQDHHRIILRMLLPPSLPRLPLRAPTAMPLLTADLSRRLGPRHRLPPRHPVLRPLPQLPDPARRGDLRNRSLAELDMPAMREPG